MEAMNKIIAYLLLLASLTAAPLASASDLARERRLADEIVDAIMDGEPLYLKAGEHEFLTISTESATDTTRGGAILLHGRGYHPDWENVIQPLRVGLTEDGWHTLSLQMPVLEKSAKYYEYVPLFKEAHPRIEAAIAHLREQGIDKIVIIAHSCGAHMAMDWVRAKGDADFDAYVGIGMGATDYKQKMAEPFPFGKITKPVLDIYGGNDYPAVIRMAPERLTGMQKGDNPHSIQHRIEGADHYFNGHNDELVEIVRDWLQRIGNDH